MPAPLRVALYARVSTSDQSLGPQLDVLRKYAEARGWEAREFVDHGRSGRNDQREGLKAVLEAARRRQVDAVAVVKLDRLGRSLAHLMAVLGELEGLDVAFISLDDGIDTQRRRPGVSSCRFVERSPSTRPDSSVSGPWRAWKQPAGAARSSADRR